MFWELELHLASKLPIPSEARRFLDYQSKFGTYAVILEPPKIKSDSFHFFPIYFPQSDGTRCHDLSFLNVEF